MILITSVCIYINIYTLCLCQVSKINALTQDRSIPAEVDFLASRAIKGRPLGLEALWLLRGAQDNAECCIDKEDHHLSKAILKSAAFWQARKEARAALWALRVEQPIVLRLFRLEATVPLELLGGVEPSLWEPECVF